MKNQATPLLVFTLGAVASMTGAAFAKGDPAPADVPADLTTIKDLLRIYTDGKNHYVAVVPFVGTEQAYFGDGKTFHALPGVSNGRDGTTSFQVSFWHPRASAGAQGSWFELKGGKYQLTCGDRTTGYQPVPEAAGKAMIASAKWFKPWFKYRPIMLARDEGGTYYFVDRPQEPSDNKNFRVFVGKKGKLKSVKLTDTVSDDAGQTFITASGHRLVRDRFSGAVWAKGKDRTGLIDVSLSSENDTLLYKELGVYAADRFGTPCDSQ